jgi:translation elongation factor EF-Tu-like GTPase
MSGPSIGLRLKIAFHLLSTDEGGRVHAISDKYRPHCVVKDAEGETEINMFQLRIRQDVAPGGSGTGTLEFDVGVAALAKAKLPPGSDFALVEGRRVVALGHVVAAE